METKLETREDLLKRVAEVRKELNGLVYISGNHRALHRKRARKLELQTEIMRLREFLKADNLCIECQNRPVWVRPETKLRIQKKESPYFGLCKKCIGKKRRLRAGKK